MTQARQFTKLHLDMIVSASVVAASAAAQVIRDGALRAGSLEWQTKGPADYLSEIDLRAEREIRDVIRSTLDHVELGLPTPPTVLGEESWKVDDSFPAGLVFVVDPLDGTTNFLHGLPNYAVSIGALFDGELIAGVVLDVTRDEVFSATLAGGATLNGQPISVSNISEPARALIGTGFPFGGNADILRYAEQFVPVACATAGIRRCGSAAIDLAWIACGRLDAFWELSVHPWDIAAGLLLIREAGGAATDLSGNAAGIFTSPLVAGNTPMHRWLRESLTRGAGESQ